MNKASPQIVLNPVMLLIDDGCPHYQGLDDLPILLTDRSDVPLERNQPDDDTESQDKYAHRFFGWRKHSLSVRSYAELSESLLFGNDEADRVLVKLLEKVELDE